MRLDLTRLARLISYRRHLERLAKAELADAVSALGGARDEESALLASRREHESACSGWREALSDELRDRYAHLARLERDLSELRRKIEDLEETVASRRDDFLEARKEVQKLEALGARIETRGRQVERRRNQRILDGHAIRKHHTGSCG